MLYSLTVHFKAEDDAVIPSTRGYHAYALFLNILRRAHPDLSARLHAADPKPFTLSPLQGKFGRSGEKIALAGGQTYWMRLTFLEDESFARFLDAALKSADRTLQLDQALLRIQEVRTVPGSSSMCRCRAFDDLLGSASDGSAIHLRFLSPTALRSAGQRNVLLPQPRPIFTGYFLKWQAFSPIQLPEDLLDLIERSVRLSRYRLQTHALFFGAYQETGFEGTCTFTIEDSLPPDARRLIRALGEFSFFCGTGAKTAMGMGQTLPFSR